MLAAVLALVSALLGGGEGPVFRLYIPQYHAGWGCTDGRGAGVCAAKLMLCACGRHCDDISHTRSVSEAIMTLVCN